MIGTRWIKKIIYGINNMTNELMNAIVSAITGAVAGGMVNLLLDKRKENLEYIKEKKKIYEDFGEMIFTHFGVSGPIILSGSAHLLRYKNVEELFNKGSIKLIIDLKPALTYEKLDSRVLRDFNAEKNKLFRNALDNLLPKKLIEPVIELSGINENKRVNINIDSY